MPTTPLVLVLHPAALPPALADKGWTTQQVADISALEQALAEAQGPVLLVVGEGDAEAAAEALAPPEDATEEVPQGVSVQQHGQGEAPDLDGLVGGPAPGWQKALQDLKGELDLGFSPMLPESLHRLAPVRQVLEQAGQRGRVTTASGEVWVACGYPDLLRPGSKVLLVRETEERPEVVALHRHPRRVGVCVMRESDGYLPGTDWDPDPLALERTGRKLEQWGTLFALEGDAVYTERGGKVFRWDGRKESDCGTASQAMATLVLRWSQR